MTDNSNTTGSFLNFLKVHSEREKLTNQKVRTKLKKWKVKSENKTVGNGKRKMKTKKKGINSKPKSDIFAKSWTNNNKILFDLKKQSHYISYETH